jgi:hypothetical protein
MVDASNIGNQAGIVLSDIQTNVASIQGEAGKIFNETAGQAATAFSNIAGTVEASVKTPTQYANDIKYMGGAAVVGTANTSLQATKDAVAGIQGEASKIFDTATRPLTYTGEQFAKSLDGAVDDITTEGNKIMNGISDLVKWGIAAVVIIVLGVAAILLMQRRK